MLVQNVTLLLPFDVQDVVHDYKKLMLVRRKIGS